MKKYTQRELINEISWSGVATGIGKGIGRAGLGLLRSISPTAGKLVDKLIKVDDNKTYGIPMDAVEATIKYLLKTGQIASRPRNISEIDATKYAKLKQYASGNSPDHSRHKTFNLNLAKRTKYYYVGFERSVSNSKGLAIRNPNAPGEYRQDMLFTVVKAPHTNKLETVKWRVEKVEDATPPPKPGGEVGYTSSDADKASADIARKAAAAKPDPATTYLASRGVRKKIKPAS